MNKEYIKFHLNEAIESLEEIISSLNEDKDYDEGEFYFSLVHLYQHINMSWNARESTESEAEECSDQNYAKWVQFPKDIELG